MFLPNCAPAQSKEPTSKWPEPAADVTTVLLATGRSVLSRSKPQSALPQHRVINEEQ